MILSFTALPVLSVSLRLKTLKRQSLLIDEKIREFNEFKEVSEIFILRFR